MTSEFVNTNEIKFEDLNHDPDMMFAKSLRDQVRKFLIFTLFLLSLSIQGCLHVCHKYAPIWPFS